MLRTLRECPIGREPSNKTGYLEKERHLSPHEEETHGAATAYGRKPKAWPKR